MASGTLSSTGESGLRKRAAAPIGNRPSSLLVATAARPANRENHSGIIGVAGDLPGGAPAVQNRRDSLNRPDDRLLVYLDIIAQPRQRIATTAADSGLHVRRCRAIAPPAENFKTSWLY